MRKIPKQPRAIATVEAILEATAQLLGAGEQAKLTTNHIAERAGVSIGTLYQYFGDTDAILVALSRRESRAIADQVVSEIEKVEVAGPEQTTRNVIRFLIAKSSDRKVLKRLTILGMIQSLQSGRDERLVNLVSRTITEKLGASEAGDARSEMYSFILTRAVLSTIRSAMIEQPAYLASKDFEDMLVSMVMAFREAQYGGVG